MNILEVLLTFLRCYNLSVKTPSNFIYFDLEMAYTFSRFTRGIIKGGRVGGYDQTPSPIPPCPMNALWKSQWKSVNKLITKKHTLAKVATTKADTNSQKILKKKFETKSWTLYVFSVFCPRIMKFLFIIVKKNKKRKKWNYLYFLLQRHNLAEKLIII